MAVQAQYPSNILLLNRNGQEGGHDYAMQPQPGGGFLDQSHILFTNGGANTNNNSNTNTRKRGREVAGGISGPTAIHQFSSSMQPQPQLIDLSQLHNNNNNNNNTNHHHQPPQPNVNVSTGLRLSFGHHDQQQHHPHYQQQQQSSIVTQSSTAAFISLLSEDFTTQIKRQHDEIDQFLQAQGEQLRRTLAEKRQRHYRAILSAAEESISRRLKETEAEVETATRRNAELEARVTQLTVQAQVWQAKARAQEAAAASLQMQLQHAVISGGGVTADNRRGDDGMEGCSGGAGFEGQADDAESAYVDPERVTMLGGPSCKGCRKRAATVVVLPCRHLCMCTECDQVAQACPLCLQVRNSSVEVFLS